MQEMPGIKGKDNAMQIILGIQGRTMEISQLCRVILMKTILENKEPGIGNCREEGRGQWI